MHWKILAYVSATILFSAILHYRVRKNDDKPKLVIGLCITILLSVLALFLVFRDKIERTFVQKKDLQLLSIMDAGDDEDPYCYVKGFSDRIKLDAFPTFDQAKEKGGWSVWCMIPMNRAKISFGRSLLKHHSQVVYTFRTVHLQLEIR